MPHGKPEVVVRLDQREAWARHFPFFAKGVEQSAREGRLAGAERPGEGDNVARAERGGKCGTEGLSGGFISEGHLAGTEAGMGTDGVRGMVRVTAVPSPRSETSSTVPPCASMNWRVSGSPSPSAASPRAPPPMR